MDRAHADESVAVKFTRVMNATPSPWGRYSDFMVAGVLGGAAVFVGCTIAAQTSRPSSVLPAVLIFAALPFLVTSAICVVLRKSSRPLVVDWLAGLPFEVCNLNAVLAGLGDTIEVEFRQGAELPTRAELQPQLDKISDDLLMVGERPDERIVVLRLGVLDSKRVPLRTNHARWVRLCATVEKVLLPLHEKRPIARIIVV